MFLHGTPHWATVDLSCSTVVLAFTFIRPLLGVASDSPEVGCTSEIGATSSVFCRGFPQLYDDLCQMYLTKVHVWTCLYKGSMDDQIFSTLLESISFFPTLLLHLQIKPAYRVQFFHTVKSEHDGVTVRKKRKVQEIMANINLYDCIF